MVDKITTVPKSSSGSGRAMSSKFEKKARRGDGAKETEMCDLAVPQDVGFGGASGSFG